MTDNEVKSFVKDYGMVIADECHHISAVNYEQVLKAVNARYVYGLTATPFRKDGHHPVLFMQCTRSDMLLMPKPRCRTRPSSGCLCLGLLHSDL